MRRFLTFCRVRDGSSVGGTPHVHLAQATRMGGCWAACYSSIRHAYGAAADGHPEFTVCGGGFGGTDHLARQRCVPFFQDFPRTVRLPVAMLLPDARCECPRHSSGGLFAFPSALSLMRGVRHAETAASEWSAPRTWAFGAQLASPLRKSPRPNKLLLL